MVSDFKRIFSIEIPRKEIVLQSGVKYLYNINIDKVKPEQNQKVKPKGLLTMTAATSTMTT